MNIPSVVRAIHAAPPKIVYVFSGVGVEALAWLHSVAGSSRTILEAVDAYSKTSMEAVAGHIEKHVSRDVARSMALWARQRALDLNGSMNPVLGVAITGAIATDRQRHGPDHAYLCVTGPTPFFEEYYVSFDKGSASRELEENFIAEVVLHAIARASGVPSDFDLASSKYIASYTEGRAPTHPEIFDVVEGSVPGCAYLSDSQLVKDIRQKKFENALIMPGSFNPIHRGHKALMQEAVRALGSCSEVLYEITVSNADKGTVSYEDAVERLKQFKWEAVAFTRARLLVEKAALFPGATFAIGADTLQRVLNAKYYDYSVPEMLSRIDAHGCRIFVMPRGGKTLQDFDIPSEMKHMFLTTDAPQIELSSTEIRVRKNK